MIEIIIRMKVVILGDNRSVHIQEWISSVQASNKVELHVITFDNGVKFEGVTYHSLVKFGSSKFNYLLNIFRVKSIVKSINPDLIHAHYATSYGFLARYSGFHPYIITGWGADIFDSPKNIIMKKVLINSFKNADAISVLSEITRSEMKKLTPKYVHLIPFGVDVNKFTPKITKNPNLVRIGTIRTLSEKYGVEFLIRAFEKLSKKHENIQLEIVGDGPLRPYLENLVKEFGLENKVIFHGYINQNSSFDQYIKILSSFEIFAILSILDSETFGVAAVEASACGIPVVATSVGGLPEVVKSEITGIIVPPQDVEATFMALDRLVSNISLRHEMGINGRLNVLKKYNWLENTNQMLDLYSQTIKSSKINKHR
ncbi:MAG: glycosyltransferase [Bacteroidota bacterium]